jgi:hypothetical protein
MPFPVADTIRIAATAVTSLSVGKVVSEVIKHNTSPNTRLDKIQLQVGGAALSMVIAGAATTRAEEFVRSVAEKVASRTAEKATTPNA